MKASSRSMSSGPGSGQSADLQAAVMEQAMATWGKGRDSFFSPLLAHVNLEASPNSSGARRLARARAEGRHVSKLEGTDPLSLPATSGASLLMAWATKEADNARARWNAGPPSGGRERIVVAPTGGLAQTGASLRRAATRPMQKSAEQRCAARNIAAVCSTVARRHR